MEKRIWALGGTLLFIRSYHKNSTLLKYIFRAREESPRPIPSLQARPILLLNGTKAKKEEEEISDSKFAFSSGTLPKLAVRTEFIGKLLQRYIHI